MAARRLVQRSLAIAAMLSLCSPAVRTVWAGQESVQKLLERGALDEAVQRAGRDRGNPESTYLAAQALIKMNDDGGAGERYSQLGEMGEDWKAIGDSGRALLSGDVGGAESAANRAIDANGGNPFAHYQAGLVASKKNDFARAASEFARSVEIKPDFAYGHYYAGLAYQKLRQTAKMSQHLEAFLRLAPDAPERAAITAVLRTLRGRR
jgi:tetratricopeptide (TPR) repeat protein